MIEKAFNIGLFLSIIGLFLYFSNEDYNREIQKQQRIEQQAVVYLP